jgi:hypothetical protein
MTEDKKMKNFIWKKKKVSMFKSTDDQTDTLRSKFLNRQKTDR